MESPAVGAQPTARSVKSPIDFCFCVPHNSVALGPCATGYRAAGFGCLGRPLGDVVCGQRMASRRPRPAPAQPVPSPTTPRATWAPVAASPDEPERNWDGFRAEGAVLKRIFAVLLEPTDYEPRCCKLEAASSPRMYGARACRQCLPSELERAAGTRHSAGGGKGETRTHDPCSAVLGRAGRAEMLGIPGTRRVDLRDSSNRLGRTAETQRHGGAQVHGGVGGAVAVAWQLSLLQVTGELSRARLVRLVPTESNSLSVHQSWLCSIHGLLRLDSIWMRCCRLSAVGCWLLATAA